MFSIRRSKYTMAVTLQEVHNRIQLLLSEHGPMIIDALLILYKNTYGYVLETKPYGGGKIKKFLMNVPGIMFVNNKTLKLSTNAIVQNYVARDNATAVRSATMPQYKKESAVAQSSLPQIGLKHFVDLKKTSNVSSEIEEPIVDESSIKNGLVLEPKHIFQQSRRSISRFPRREAFHLEMKQPLQISRKLVC